MKKKASKHYIPSKCYVVCNFDINLLPVKLNLPMIFLPSKWELPLKKPIMLSDMSGGYLSRLTVDFYNRFSVITSHNYNNFNIVLEKKMDKFILILNGLQSQKFTINSMVFEFIIKK